MTIDCLAVWEAGSRESRCCCGRFLPEAVRGSLFSALPLASGGCRQVWAPLGLSLCHLNLPASVSYGFLPVCLCVSKPPSPFKESSHWI